MNNFLKRYMIIIILVLVLVLGQVISYFANPSAWQQYASSLGTIVSMIAFWGPIVAMISSVLVWLVMRLLGFESLDAIHQESVEQNNPAPAILFVGTLIASVLFLMLVIKP
jgi:heme/copper-type cytochrome/quinol oxidase subunit 2